MPTRASLRRHPGLRWFNIPIAVTSIAGAVLVATLAIGWVDWTAFAFSGVVGLALGIPAGLWATREIKDRDPGWPPGRLTRNRAKSAR